MKKPRFTGDDYEAMCYTEWELVDAIVFIRALESHLSQHGWHVGVTGGVLFAGLSENDLDVIVYPHTTADADRDKVREAMESFGMSRILDADAVKREHRRRKSSDEKIVEIWRHEQRRVDVFILR